MPRGRTWAIAVLTLAALVPLALEANARAGECPPRVLDPDVCGSLAPIVAPDEATRRRALLAGARDAATLEATAGHLVVALPAAELGAVNGFACHEGPMAVVRDDLPPAADAYVRLHELWHLAHPGDSESETNAAAARHRPWGMARTVLFSVGTLFAGDRSLRCGLASAWTSFKVYFTPWG